MITFQACYNNLPQEDKDEFEESCAYEICEMGAQDEDGICSFADALSTRCTELEMPVDWRSADFCGNYKIFILYNC